MRQVNADGIALTKRYEGLALNAYQDEGGVWTIGYGHTGPDVVKGLTCTMDQADAWLDQDMAIASRCTFHYVGPFLTDNQFAALSDFVFNMGAGRFISSTLLRVINLKDFDAVPLQLRRWVFGKDAASGKLVVVPGLVLRRAAEADLWNQA